MRSRRPWLHRCDACGYPGCHYRGSVQDVNIQGGVDIQGADIQGVDIQGVDIRVCIWISKQGSVGGGRGHNYVIRHVTLFLGLSSVVAWSDQLVLTENYSEHYTEKQNTDSKRGGKKPWMVSPA